MRVRFAARAIPGAGSRVPLCTMSSPVTEIIDVIDTLTPEELDRLPFGVIFLDCEGMVLKYNAFESEVSGRTKAQVLGRLFFSQIAPCTNVPEFGGTFFEHVELGTLNHHFIFEFPFRPLARTVHIHMLSGPNKTSWIFVSDRDRGLSVSAELEKLRE
jgi:methyl-accepting chemotaxis protein